MVNCPDCGHENIEGADTCEMCEQSLIALSKPRPSSRVERSIMKSRVSSLVPREPLVVAPDTPVGEVVRRLINRSVGCAIVVEGHKVVGIFTERDALVRLNVEAGRLAERPVSEFMTDSVETLEMTDRIAFALHKMDLGGYRHFPVLNDGRIAGFVSVRDMLRHITTCL